eukprot:GHVT01072669.1.p1 GENE.GHVT01072669.1~~GHVT01072669.1.p1  ORF type:complete len:798 (+),score=117.80 GHVT01072669.1:2898-5291(+)
MTRSTSPGVPARAPGGDNAGARYQQAPPAGRPAAAEISAHPSADTREPSERHLAVTLDFSCFFVLSTVVKRSRLSLCATRLDLPPCPRWAHVCRDYAVGVSVPIPPFLISSRPSFPSSPPPSASLPTSSSPSSPAGCFPSSSGCSILPAWAWARIPFSMRHDPCPRGETEDEQAAQPSRNQTKKLKTAVYTYTQLAALQDTRQSYNVWAVVWELLRPIHISGDTCQVDVRVIDESLGSTAAECVAQPKQVYSLQLSLPRGEKPSSMPVFTSGDVVRVHRTQATFKGSKYVNLTHINHRTSVCLWTMAGSAAAAPGGANATGDASAAASVSRTAAAGGGATGAASGNASGISSLPLLEDAILLGHGKTATFSPEDAQRLQQLQSWSIRIFSTRTFTCSPYFRSLNSLMQQTAYMAYGDLVVRISFAGHRRRLQVSSPGGDEVAGSGGESLCECGASSYCVAVEDASLPGRQVQLLGLTQPTVQQLSCSQFPLRRGQWLRVRNARWGACSVRDSRGVSYYTVYVAGGHKLYLTRLPGWSGDAVYALTALIDSTGVGRDRLQGVAAVADDSDDGAEDDVLPSTPVSGWGAPATLGVNLLGSGLPVFTSFASAAAAQQHARQQQSETKAFRCRLLGLRMIGVVPPVNLLAPETLVNAVCEDCGGRWRVPAGEDPETSTCPTCAAAGNEKRCRVWLTMVDREGDTFPVLWDDSKLKLVETETTHQARATNLNAKIQRAAAFIHAMVQAVGTHEVPVTVVSESSSQQNQTSSDGPTYRFRMLPHLCTILAQQPELSKAENRPM